MDRTTLPFAHLMALPKRKAKASAVTQGIKGKAGAAPKRIAPRPKRTTLASFANLGRALAEDDTPDLQDADDANGQAASVPCDYCEGTGEFAGGDCPLCDGEGEQTLTQVHDRAQDIVDVAASRDCRTAAKMTAASQAERPAAATAAAIISAGKRRRGELPPAS